MEANVFSVVFFFLLLATSALFITHSLSLFKMVIRIKGLLVGLLLGLLIGAVINNFEDITVPIISALVFGIIGVLIAYPLHKILVYLIAAIGGAFSGFIVSLLVNVGGHAQTFFIILFIVGFVYLTYKIYEYWVIVLLSGTPILMLLIANAMINSIDVFSLIDIDPWGKLVVEHDIIYGYIRYHIFEFLSTLLGIPLISIIYQKKLLINSTTSGHEKIYKSLILFVMYFVFATSVFFIGKPYNNSYFLNYSLGSFSFFILYLSFPCL